MGYRHGSVDERLETMLDDAEARGSCLVPTNERDRKALRRRVGSELLEVSRGMFARASFWEARDPAQRALARARALAVRHPAWVFCETTAAIAHGLAVPYRLANPLCVAVPSYSRADPAGCLRFVRATPETVDERQGIPVTPLIQTLAQTMRHVGFPEALALLNSALHQDLVSAASAAAALERRARRRSGVAILRRALAFCNPRSENGGESEARAAMIDLDFQVPFLPVSFVDPVEPWRTYRVDYLWALDDGTLVAGELDGRVKTVDPTMLAGRSVEEMSIDERRREARLTALGMRIVRFSPATVRNRRDFAALLDAYRIPHCSPAEQLRQATEQRDHQDELLKQLGLRNLLIEQQPHEELAAPGSQIAQKSPEPAAIVLSTPTDAAAVQWGHLGAVTLDLPPLPRNHSA